MIDEEKAKSAQRRFGTIPKRVVLYRGEDVQLDNGVLYRNVEKYLRAPAAEIAQV